VDYNFAVLTESSLNECQILTGKYLTINFGNVLKVERAGLLQALERLVQKQLEILECVFSHLIPTQRPANFEAVGEILLLIFEKNLFVVLPTHPKSATDL
jgi:hypothetical protein